MTREIRWRILTLQIVATLVLAFSAGVGYWAYNFTHDQVRNQLVEQKIVFPPATSVAIAKLPAADASAMKEYAGQQMVNGYQAHTYAEHCIRVHLNEMGMTYSQASAKALANPKDVKAAALANTLFKGETLRSLLLQAWAFWFVGTLALYAAIALTAGAGIVFLAFLFELLVAPRREGVVELKVLAKTQGTVIPVS